MLTFGRQLPVSLPGKSYKVAARFFLKEIYGIRSDIAG
jgi:hypothetical protein